MGLRRAFRSVAVVGLMVLIVTACSEDTTTGPAAGGGGGETSAPADGGGTEVATADVGGVGEVLVDGEGLTLYLFEQDTGDVSTCTEDCAESWPALTTDGDPVAGDGVDASLLGTSEHPDGSTQVTYAGHPLYYFSGDTAVGDAKGQGLGEVWYLVSPDGNANEAKIKEGGGDRAGY